MASDYFGTVQALEMVLRDGSDLDDEGSVEDNFNNREIDIWHVVPFFHETEVFLNDRYSTFAAMSQAFAATREDIANNSLFIFFNFLDDVKGAATKYLLYTRLNVTLFCIEKTSID